MSNTPTVLLKPASPCDEDASAVCAAVGASLCTEASAFGAASLVSVMITPSYPLPAFSFVVLPVAAVFPF